MASTKSAVAILAPERIDIVASIKAKIVDPENPGNILAGCQLKIKKAKEAPVVIKASLAMFN